MKTNASFPTIRTHWATMLLVTAAASALTIGARAASQPCVLFDDLSGDAVQSDGGDQNSPYCNAPKKNVTVGFSNDGHSSLDTNSSNRTGVGRSVFIDFGVPITVIDRVGVNWTFQTTDQLEAAGVKHDASLVLGGFQDNFNMLTMTLNEQRLDVNLTINLCLHFPGQSQEVPIFIKLAPEVLGNYRQCEISDPVKVTCISVDAAGKANAWRVDTQDPNNRACVSQDPFGHLLTDLTIGLRNLSFGFTVTK